MQEVASRPIVVYRPKDLQSISSDADSGSDPHAWIDASTDLGEAKSHEDERYLLTNLVWLLRARW